MKFLTTKQIVLLTVVLVGIVFVVALIKLNSGGGDSPQGPTGPSSFEFPDRIARLGEVEWKMEHHHDFWFAGSSTEHVELILYSKGCKCSDIQIAFAPGEWKNLSRDEQKRRGPCTECIWHELTVENHDGITVPAGATGWIRLSWKGDKIGRENLTATLMANGQKFDFQAEVIFTPPVRVAVIHDRRMPAGSKITLPPVGQMEAFFAHVDDLDQATAPSCQVEFLCWSPTRPRFTLETSTTNPCVIVGKPMQLTDKECQDLVKTEDQRVLCAYRVPVTVHERLNNDTQLDLGPFLFPVTFMGHDPELEGARAFVDGVVRGELSVGPPGQKDHINLGYFPAEKGTTKDRHCAQIHPARREIAVRCGEIG